MRRANLFDIKPYILNNVTKSLRFAFYNGFHCIIDKKCKFFYEILLSKKFKKPCYQSYFSREFCISKPSWRNIYKSKVLCMYDKRLSEFNYKLLNNILCCNLFLEKCKIRLNAKCDHCDEDSEDIMHLIYGCHNVNRVWKNLCKILNFSVL